MANVSEDFFADGPNDPDPLLEDLKQMLRSHSNSFARNHQKALGPSEIGHPCSRHLVGRMIGRESINPQFDPLASYIGTAAHKQMEDAAALDNENIIDQYRDWEDRRDDIGKAAGKPPRCTFLDVLKTPGRRRQDGSTCCGGGGNAGHEWNCDVIKAKGKEPIGRWLTETRVTVREGLSGTCDLYDTWTDTVIDYKFPGTSRMTLYRKQIKNGEAPSTIYRRQAHFYGRGYKNAGFDVKRVGIWLIPRAGMLSTSVLWSEPYSDQLVDDELARQDSLILLADELDVERNPERLAWIPKTAYDCAFCPFFTVRENHEDPAACQGGESFKPTVTAGSGMTPPRSAA